MFIVRSLNLICLIFFLNEPYCKVKRFTLIDLNLDLKESTASQTPSTNICLHVLTSSGKSKNCYNWTSSLVMAIVLKSNVRNVHINMMFGYRCCIYQKHQQHING